MTTYITMIRNDSYLNNHTYHIAYLENDRVVDEDLIFDSKLVPYAQPLLHNLSAHQLRQSGFVTERIGKPGYEDDLLNQLTTLLNAQHITQLEDLRQHLCATDYQHILDVVWYQQVQCGGTQLDALACVLNLCCDVPARAVDSVARAAG